MEEQDFDKVHETFEAAKARTDLTLFAWCENGHEEEVNSMLQREDDVVAMMITKAQLRDPVLILSTDLNHLVRLVLAYGYYLGRMK